MATEISENFDGGVGEGADLRGVYTRNSEGFGTQTLGIAPSNGHPDPAHVVIIANRLELATVQAHLGQTLEHKPTGQGVKSPRRQRQQRPAPSR